MPTTYCELLKATCSQKGNDGVCSICPTARTYLEEIATKYRELDSKRKKSISFFDTPADTLCIRHFEHHPVIARITRGSIFDNSDKLKD